MKPTKALKAKRRAVRKENKRKRLVERQKTHLNVTQHGRRMIIQRRKRRMR